MKISQCKPLQARVLPAIYKKIKQYALMHNRSVTKELAQLINEALELREKTTHQFANPRRK